jgi:hypothetical protein
MAELDLTNIASTSIATPASGLTAVFVDSTTSPTKRLKTRDDAGTLVPYVGIATTDTAANRLQNKDLDAASTNIVDPTDTTKKVAFTASGNSTGVTTTIASQQTTSQTLSLPNITGADTVVTTNLAQTITGVKTMTNPTTAAGTNAIPSMTLTGGTLLTNAVAGGVENDAVAMYGTTNTTDGRAQIPLRQHFRLTSNGSNVTTTIGNFFGANSNISLVASAYYDIEIMLVFTKTTTEILTITLTNSSAPTAQNIRWEQSPIGGMVAPPGAATATIGFVQGDATAAKAIAAGSLTTAVNHYIKINIQLKNGSGTSLKIQATNPAGSITPLLGSYWTATRIPTGNTGTFAA